MPHTTNTLSQQRRQLCTTPLFSASAEGKITHIFHDPSPFQLGRHRCIVTETRHNLHRQHFVVEFSIKKHE